MFGLIGVIVAAAAPTIASKLVDFASVALGNIADNPDNFLAGADNYIEKIFEKNQGLVCKTVNSAIKDAIDKAKKI